MELAKSKGLNPSKKNQLENSVKFGRSKKTTKGQVGSFQNKSIGEFNEVGSSPKKTTGKFSEAGSFQIQSFN